MALERNNRRSKAYTELSNSRYTAAVFSSFSVITLFISFLAPVYGPFQMICEIAVPTERCDHTALATETFATVVFSAVAETSSTSAEVTEA